VGGGRCLGYFPAQGRDHRLAGQTGRQPLRLTGLLGQAGAFLRQGHGRRPLAPPPTPPPPPRPPSPPPSPSACPDPSPRREPSSAKGMAVDHWPRRRRAHA